MKMKLLNVTSSRVYSNVSAFMYQATIIIMILYRMNQRELFVSFCRKTQKYGNKCILNYK